MERCKCLGKEKDRFGNIKQYKMQFIGGVVQNVKPDVLKNMIRTGQWDVINLKFTSDGRLIDTDTSAKTTVIPTSKGTFAGDRGHITQDTTKPQVNPMQFVGEVAQGLVTTSNAKTAHKIRTPFTPNNFGDVCNKFDEIVAQHPHNPWRTARENDKLNWARIIFKRWVADNKTDIVFEITKVIQNYERTLPKHRYSVVGYGNYSVDKDRFVLEDTVDNVTYDYSMLHRAITNYATRKRALFRPEHIDDWLVNIVAQIVDAEVEDDIEEIVQGLIDEQYID